MTKSGGYKKEDFAGCLRISNFFEPLLRGLGQNMAVAVLDTQPERRLNLVEGGGYCLEIVRVLVHLVKWGRWVDTLKGERPRQSNKVAFYRAFFRQLIPS